MAFCTFLCTVALHSLSVLSLPLPQIWNSDTGEELVTCNIPSSGKINRLALSGDDQRLIVSKEDESVFVSNILYSRKYWRGINFGRLVVRIKKTAKLKSANVFLSTIVTGDREHNHQY